MCGVPGLFTAGAGVLKGILFKLCYSFIAAVPDCRNSPECPARLCASVAGQDVLQPAHVNEHWRRVMVHGPLAGQEGRWHAEQARADVLVFRLYRVPTGEFGEDKRVLLRITARSTRSPGCAAAGGRVKVAPNLRARMHALPRAPPPTPTLSLPAPLAYAAIPVHGRRPVQQQCQQGALRRARAVALLAVGHHMCSYPQLPARRRARAAAHLKASCLITLPSGPAGARDAPPSVGTPPAAPAAQPPRGPPNRRKPSPPGRRKPLAANPCQSPRRP